MQIIVDEIDGSFYADVVITPSELRALKKNEMVNGKYSFKRRNCYVGLRLQGVWDFDEEDDETISSET